MEDLNLILYLCIALPLLPLILVMPRERSRSLLLFDLVGMTLCLIAGDINNFLLQWFDGDVLYVTTALTPVSEEILKMLPVICYAMFFDDDRDTLLLLAFAEGIGFSVLENAVILTENLSSLSIQWAFFRLIGAALMHGACTAAVGHGISYIRKRRKIFYCGTFSLLSAAILFHAVFNVFIQSAYSWAAFCLTAALYSIVAYIRFSQG